MKKKVLISIGAVIVIIIGLFVAVLLNLGTVIKTVVNTYGPGITKTKVRLSDVDVSLLSARAEIRGFYLGNPGSFKSQKALAVESIYIDVDEKSLISDPIIIEKIEVSAPDITYEKQGGTDNIQTILNNIKEKADTRQGSGEKTGERGKTGAGIRVVIKDVIIRDGRITLATSLLEGNEITIPLPEIHLTNLGQKKGGVSPAEAAREIFAQLYEKITAPDMTNALNDRLRKLGLTLGESKKAVTGQATTAGEGVEQRVKALGDKIKGLLGK
jgi:hypothetical protein